jgi:hypothetical protein
VQSGQLCAAFVGQRQHQKVISQISHRVLAAGGRRENFNIDMGFSSRRSLAEREICAGNYWEIGKLAARRCA